jgi:hypothetical protein
MNDKHSIFRQFAEKNGNGMLRADSADEQPEDLVAFGWLRGSRERATMLEIRRRDGSIVALGYAWLERADFDPSEGITLKFTGQTVRLVGRNLNREVRPHLRLFLGLARHRIPWLQEADEPTAMTTPKDATVIEQVEFL